MPRSPRSSATSVRSSSARCWPRRSHSWSPCPFSIGDRAVHLALCARAQLAAPGRLRHRPAGRRPVGGLRPVGRPRTSAPYLVSRRTSGSHAHLGFIPVLRGRRLGHRQARLHRRHRARDHDPADHHRDLPRDLRADAAAARGGRAGPGRDALGDDPATRSSPTPAPAWSPASCSASAGRSARRWPWRWCSSASAADHAQPDLDTNPRHDRLQHRLELHGGDAGAGSRS